MAITPENLSKVWRIGLDTAKKTLRVTTQRGVRTAVHPITRRYRVDHLALHRNRLNDEFYTDTLFSRVKSLETTAPKSSPMDITQRYTQLKVDGKLAQHLGTLSMMSEYRTS